MAVEGAPSTNTDTSSSALDPQQQAALDGLKDTLNKALLASTEGAKITAEGNTAIKIISQGGQHN